MRSFGLRIAASAGVALLAPAPRLHALDCSAAASIDLSSPAPIAGDTSGRPSLADSYACVHSSYGAGGPQSGLDGGEEVWQFTLAAPAVVYFDFRPSDPGQRLLLLSSCAADSCLDLGGCGENLAAGTYYLVVDGPAAAAGPYTLAPRTLAPFVYNRWFQCPENPRNGETPDHAALRTWGFDSGNYCGTGCDFSMFAVVGCGTEMHVPFWDPETGHLAIRDLLAGRAVDLVATNRNPWNPPSLTCPFTASGDLVAWEDSGCSSIPCPGGACGGGTDCRTNNQLIDVSMLGSPNLCGVFRLDFLDWGGFVWDAYANCSADRSEQFYLYRDLCSALVSYRPRPEIGIGDLYFGPCTAAGEVTGTITLENVGCVDALPVEIGISQAPPAPPNPRTFTASVAAGQSIVVPWVYTTTERPADLVFRVDPANKLDECSEDLASSVSCGLSATLSRERTAHVCDALKSVTFPHPGGARYLCAPQDLVLDGEPTAFRCAPGGDPQWRWEDLAGNALPGCDWSSSARCAVPASALPPGKSRFTLKTRCTGVPATGEAGATTAVIVGASVAPQQLGNVLRAVRDGDDVTFSWMPVAGSGASALRLYRDSAPAVQAPARGLLATLPPSELEARDRGGVSSGPSPAAYYQLVTVSCDGATEGAN